MILIVIISAIVMLSWAIPPPTPFWVRTRTDREEALHDLIQQAMNWTPDMFTQRADGRWFNAKGEEGIRVTWEELCKMHQIEDKD